MARETVEALNGYLAELQQGQRQVHRDGMPIFNGSGEPQMEDVWLFVYSATKPDGEKHVVMGPMFNAEGKEKLVQALTGGIVVPTVHLPNGVPGI